METGQLGSDQVIFRRRGKGCLSKIIGVGFLDENVLDDSLGIPYVVSHQNSM